MLQPVLDMVLEQAALQPGHSVVDIGCGAGTSVVQAARAVGSQGMVLGVDVSAPLLDHANRLITDIPNAQVREADAQVADLGGPFDGMISRFGVMFFDDTPAAFANIAKALKPRVPLVMAAWANAGQNPYFMEAAAAAHDILGKPPKTDRSLPGPFAFEHPERVQRDLAAAGLVDIEIDTRELSLPMAASLDAAGDLAMAIGPAQSVMRHFEGTPADSAAIRARIMDRFAQFQTDHGVNVPALVHLITARTNA